MILKEDQLKFVYLDMESKIFYSSWYHHQKKYSQNIYLNMIYQGFQFVEQNLNSDLLFLMNQSELTNYFTVYINTKNETLKSYLSIYYPSDKRFFKLRSHRHRLIKTVSNFNTLDNAKENLKKRIKKELKRLNWETKLEELILKEL